MYAIHYNHLMHLICVMAISFLCPWRARNVYKGITKQCDKSMVNLHLLKHTRKLKYISKVHKLMLNLPSF